MRIAEHGRLTLFVLLLLVIASCRFAIPSGPVATPGNSPPVAVSSPDGFPRVILTTPVVTPVLPGEILEAPPPPQPPPLQGDQVLTLAGSPDGPLTLDPALVRDVESAFVVQQLFRGLVRFDPSLRPVPELAERIEVSPDGRTYTVWLRPDITFHDGTPITAGDIKYSFERACDPALNGGDGQGLPAWGLLRDLVGAEDRLRGRRSDIPGIQVLDERTLQLRLEAPRTTFLLRLALPVASVVQRANVEQGPEWWRHPIGSGPFRLLRWDPEELVLGPHRDYRPQPPYLREVRVAIGSAALSPLHRYERGQLDIANVPPWAVDRLSAPESPYRDQLVVQPLFAGTYIFFNPAVPPLDDPAVRRALIHAFPREKVAKVTLRGKVQLAEGIVPEGMPGSPWTAAMIPSNPGVARDLLAGRQLQLVVVSAGDDLAVILAQVWKQELGVNVEVLQLDWPDYLDDLHARRLPIFVFSWVADYPDPEAVLDALFATDSPVCPITYENPRIQRLLEQARHALDPNERRTTFLAAQQAILDEGIVLPLTFDVEYLLVAPRVRDLPLTPLGILGLERVWIEGSRPAR